jgi:RNA polymerase sigma-70 factor, ECF subfamily
MDNWQGIAAQYGPLVWKTAWRLLAHREDTADCFQETFLAAMHIARRQEVRNWPGLLQRLATARALDALRRRIRHNGRHTRIPDDSLLPSAEPGPDQLAAAAELAGQLRDALARVPAAQAEVFCLREICDLTYEQIAAATGLSVDAVGVNLHRARTRLREMLERMCSVGPEWR